MNKAIAKPFALIASLLLACTVSAFATAAATPQTAHAASAIQAMRASSGKVTVAKGSSYSLNIKVASGTTLSCTSSKTKVATVTKKGLIRGKKPGTATITVKAKKSGKTYTKKFKVTVVKKSAYNKYATGLKAKISSKTIDEGDTYKITATVSGASNKNVTFSSSKPRVASVDAYGNVTGIKSGTAKITVKTVAPGKSKSHLQATLTIKVNAAVSALTPVIVAHGYSYGFVGISLTFLVETQPAGYNFGTLVFTSENPSIAKVESTGKQTRAEADGTVKTYDTFKVTGVSKGTTSFNIGYLGYPDEFIDYTMVIYEDADDKAAADAAKTA